MGKNIGKNVSKNLSGKYNQKLLDYAKKSATDALKTSSKRVIQKTVKSTGNLIANRITKISKNSEHDKEMSMIKKYLKRDMFFQKKDKKLLMN